MATLTGKIIDVTNQPPGSVVDIHVKAPSARVGSGTGAVVSSPAEVDYNPSTGELTITDLTGGLSWLVIEGVGWSDTVALAVAEGMTTLVEAIANAAGAPGMADYARLLGALETRVDDIAQGAVDVAIDTRMDDKADVSTVNDLAAVTMGVTGVSRSNSRSIREIVSELATKVDQAVVDAALAGKADTDTVDELTALAVSALGVGRGNADRIRQLESGENDQYELDTALAGKADTRTLDARVPAGGIPGQLLMATPGGGKWSWAGRYPTNYHDNY